MKYLWILFLFPFAGWCQQPSHFGLGDDALDGINIYEILHTSSGVYLISTNNGLFQFDGYDFVRIECDFLLGESLFNLVEDENGSIYSSNLNGQIVRISETDCESFYHLPDSLYYRDIHLAIDDAKRLVVNTDHHMVLDSTGRIISNTRGIGFGRMSSRKKGELMFYSTNPQEIWTWSNDLLSKRKFNLKEEMSNESGHPFLFRKKELFSTSVQGRLYEVTNGKPKLIFDPSSFTNEQSFRTYVTENSIWLASNSVGVYHIDSTLQLVNEQPYFANNTISAVTEDKEGNILLGTFGKGIIVIPKLSTQDLKIPEREEAVSVTVLGTVLFFGTRSGVVYRYDKIQQFQTVRSKKVKSMEALFSLGYDELLLGEFDALHINLSNGLETELNIGSVKDVFEVSDSTHLIATNQGAYWYNKITRDAQRMDGSSRRHYTVGFNTVTKRVYLGTADGLYLVDSLNQKRVIELDHSPVMARDIIECDGSMFVSTSEFGLLQFTKDTLFKIWNKDSGLISNKVGQLRAYDGKVILATDKGVQILDQAENRIQCIAQSDGLNSNRIIDMEIWDGNLVVVHSKGVQTVQIPNGFESYQIKLNIEHVFFDDSATSVVSGSKLPSGLQKLGFQLNPNTIKRLPEITYQYQLNGASDRWNTVSSDWNMIEFQSLAPGKYTFKAKANWRGEESNVVRFKFVIPTPFYKTWWFVSGVFLVLLSLSVLVLMRRHRRAQFIAQQENEIISSKLTAIRSQMNPHFIFNALNSIQGLVVKGDAKASYKYISSFSDLIRGTLTNSDKDLIQFEEELEMLKHYLELEKLRFKNELKVETLDNGVEGIEIPPMLIQPFVENALKHGLLHKKGDKELLIEFKLDNELTCVITDNGVGRKLSNEIQERQARKHSSFSTSATENRFKIMKRTYGNHLGFTIEDLENEEIPVGTRVTLRIPVVRKF